MLMHRLLATVFVAFLIVGCSHRQEAYPETMASEVFKGTGLKSELDIRLYIYSDILKHGNNVEIYRLINEPDYDFIIKWIQKPELKFERGLRDESGVAEDNLDYSWDYLFKNKVRLIAIKPFEFPVLGWTLEVEATCDRGPNTGIREIYVFEKERGNWRHCKHISKAWVTHAFPD